MARFEIAQIEATNEGLPLYGGRLPGEKSWSVVGPREYVMRRMFARTRPSRYGKARVFCADGVWHGAGGKVYSTWEAAMRSVEELRVP